MQRHKWQRFTGTIIPETLSVIENMRTVRFGSILLASLFAACGGGGGASLPSPSLPRNPEQRLAAGDSHSVALDLKGTIWSWGVNYSSQLGNGTSVSSIRPTPVIRLSGVTQVSAGPAFNLALKGDGTVWYWGQNALAFNAVTGENLVPILCNPGYPLTLNVAEPIQVAGLDHVVQISAGSNYATALRSDGTVWSWGSNLNGQLGNGNMTGSLTPVQVMDPRGQDGFSIATGY